MLPRWPARLVAGWVPMATFSVRALSRGRMVTGAWLRLIAPRPLCYTTLPAWQRGTARW